MPEFTITPSAEECKSFEELMECHTEMILREIAYNHDIDPQEIANA